MVLIVRLLAFGYYVTDSTHCNKEMFKYHCKYLCIGCCFIWVVSSYCEKINKLIEFEMIRIRFISQNISNES